MLTAYILTGLKCKDMATFGMLLTLLDNKCHLVDIGDFSIHKLGWADDFFFMLFALVFDYYFEVLLGLQRLSEALDWNNEGIGCESRPND